MREAECAKAPVVAIVIINWNGIRHTRRCLQSLGALSYPEYRACVVDNGSSDGSVEAIREEFPDVAVLARRDNDGFAAGCNAGIDWARRSGAHYVWVLNNDTEVERGSLAALVRWSESYGRPVILAPKILRVGTPDTVWSAGGLLHWPWLERGHVGEGEGSDSHTQPQSVKWASGCSLFFSTDVAERAGPFDERYFLYLEDVEWCLRAGREGVPTWVVPDSVIRHQASATTDALDPRIVRYYVNRNYFLLVFTHAGLVGRTWATLRILVTLAKTGMRVLLFPSYRGGGHYHAQTRGIFDFLRGRFGIAPYPAEIPVRSSGLSGRRAEG